MTSRIDTQALVDYIIYGDNTPERKLALLELVEPIIEREWQAGNHAVKPARLITVNDLIQQPTE